MPVAFRCYDGLLRSRRRLPREAFGGLVKNQLRTIQEQLDTEMANAGQGVVMSEGAYLTMMNAVKVLWEQVDTRPEEVN